MALPPANGGLDYQLGGPYSPPNDVEVVVRDRTSAPDPGQYSICYVNGFQTQPDEADLWLTQHAELVLRDADDEPLIDPGWPDEMILDISTAEKRAAIGDIVGEWIDQCAGDGFHAVEIDNLDTYTRFADALTEEHAVAMARTFADRAHAAGLAIGQKNSAELVAQRGETALDFAVVEECNAFAECERFIAGYGDQVYVIEYQREFFDAGCEQFPQLSIVLRDDQVTTPDSPDYVRDAC